MSERPDELADDPILIAVEERLRRQRRQDRATLLAWGVGLLFIAGLFSGWIWFNDHQQDKAMCALLRLSTARPEIPAGPAGDQARVVLKAVRDYQHTLGC